MQHAGRPRIAILASVFALLAGSRLLRGAVPNAHEPNERPNRRQRVSKQVYRTRGTYYHNLQLKESLRRRMGGNARRIKHARDGYVFLDDGMGTWIESPTVLPEEVEARVKEYRSITNYEGAVRFEIRGHLIHVNNPKTCGPVQFIIIPKEQAA